MSLHFSLNLFLTQSPPHTHYTYAFVDPKVSPLQAAVAQVQTSALGNHGHSQQLPPDFPYFNPRHQMAICVTSSIPTFA